MTALIPMAALAAALTLPGDAIPERLQVQQSEGHVHVGELGEKYLLLEKNLKFYVIDAYEVAKTAKMGGAAA